MDAIIKRKNDIDITTSVIHNVIILKHGNQYGQNSGEYLELWTNSMHPEETIMLNDETEIILKKSYF